MRPDQMRERLEDGTVNRDGLSAESYAELETAETVEELRAVLLDVFKPSGSGEDLD